MNVRLQTRVYLEDTDAGGIVYHANYLKFMERARTEFLRAAGFEQSDTFKNDLSFVVHSMTLAFFSPARLDDQLVVTCAIATTRGASFVFRQEVQSSRGDLVHCAADVTVACIRLSDQKPRRIPKAFLEAVARNDQGSPLRAG